MHSAKSQNIESARETVKGEWCLQGRSGQNDNFPNRLFVCDPSHDHSSADVVNSCRRELVDEDVCYLSVTCDGSESDTSWNIPENKDWATVAGEEWY